MKNYINHINYKEGNHIYNIISNKNHNNILLFGLPNTGKTSLINDILYDLKISSFNYNINNNDILCINEIKKIISTYDHYSNTCKYIVIDNFENIKISNQNILKILIEKSYKTTRFIIISDNLSKIIDPIKSRFIKIRISKKNIYDLEINCKWNKKNIDILNNDYQKKMLDKLFYIYKNFDIKDIKEYSLKIKEIDLDITLFLKDFLNNLIKKYDSSVINRCIKEISNYQYLLQKSYIDIIYLESLFIRIYNIINND